MSFTVHTFQYRNCELVGSNEDRITRSFNTHDALESSKVGKQCELRKHQIY